MTFIRQRQQRKNSFTKPNRFAAQTRWSWKLIKERTKNLKKLGFANILVYRRSQLFQTITKAQFAKYPNCKKCHTPATQIHLTNFRLETLRGTKTQALISLCDSCFQTVTFDVSGQKRSPQEANQVVFHWHTKAPKHPTTEQQPSLDGHESATNHTAADKPAGKGCHRLL